MLTIKWVAPKGRWGMRELMVGMIAVGLVAGIVLGRNTERARRTYRDWGTARATMEKGRKIAFAEARRAVVTSVLIGAVLLVIFIGALNLPE
jgi:hypothetical protein